MVLALGHVTGHAPVRRDLTFDERVEAQRAIERVYYSHQIGTRRPFDEAVPRDLLERKVLTYLKQSLALERIWATPVTAEALRREMERIASSSRLPERLEEIYEALGRDAFLIQETLARATLVDRLARSFFAFDERVHAEARDRALRLRERVMDGALAPLAHAESRTVVEYTTSRSQGRAPRTADREQDRTAAHLHVEMESEEFGEWRRSLAGTGEAGPLMDTPESFGFRVLLEEEPGTALVASYAVPKTTWDDWWDETQRAVDESEVRAVAAASDVLFELRIPAFDRATGETGESDPGAGSLCCAPSDFWSNGSLDDAHPAQRWEHVAVWTGNEMLVWGGRNNSGSDLGGARYDPLTDTWATIASNGSPPSCCNSSALWTGSEMLVWGGTDQSLFPVDVGGRYNPETDTWEPISTVGAPVARYLHSAVWTGSSMIVWGGATQKGAIGPTQTGGRYDPSTDTWSPTSTTNTPSARRNHTTVWTGSRMIVWGGAGATALVPRGSSYDPVLDTWAPISDVGAPSARERHTAVWTESRMIVWGGSPELNTGGRYDPVTDTWLPTSMVNVPPGANRHTAVWTGSRMIVWGGMGNTESATYSGGVYDETADTWTATQFFNVPGARSHHTAIWTGTEMIVWGGANVSTLEIFHTGGRYNPVANAWTATNAPAGRWAHTAVWTGNLMVIWGGIGEIWLLSNGSRYDPMTDSWSATSSIAAPSARAGHSAVWTGTEMILWGGFGRTGSRYDPVADSWMPTSTTGAPSPRRQHTAVWTGDSMIIWGGDNDAGSGQLDSGGRYDPDSDAWLPTSTAGAPSPRQHHTAVWTGDRMIVWGGADDLARLGDGGRYDPAGDMWEPLSSAGSPSPRWFHSATWTASEMVVWGGWDDICPGDGARYRPASDEWQPMSSVQAPSACSHSAVWTGDHLIVWGGATSAGAGGRYTLLTDTWTPMTFAGAPPGRSGHRAVWTGKAMIAWGGEPPPGDPSPTSTGGIYFPSSDSSPDDDSDGVTLCGGDCADSDPAVWPTAPQVCDGRNNDCRHPNWPSLAGTNETDDDGDSFAECQGDCDDSAGLVWTTPGEARSLTFLSDTSTLTWTPPLIPGGSAIVYDAMRSADAADFVGPAVCVESDGTDTIAVDSSIPPPGGVLFYLVRAGNSCPGSLGLGPTGFDSAGAPRMARSCP